MMDHDDFQEINRLLEKSCDQCLLTRRHCADCRIEKLRMVVGKLSVSRPLEIILIELDELKVLLDLAGETGKGAAEENEVFAKWRRIVERTDGRELTV